MNEEQRNRKKLIAGLLCLLILALYAGGVLRQFMVDAGHISLNPIRCLYFAVSSIHGIKTTVFTILLFFAFAGIVVFQGSISDTSGEDKERNFTYSKLGTYGTAGYMEDAERRRVLKEDKDIRKVEGIIFGLEMMSGNVLSLPVDSKLNRNIAVCGSQGSMKSRAFARNMILQCARRGESMFITDPKSELYEDMVAYLKAQRYTVRQWNLIDLENSDAWDCLAEIDEGGLIDIFVDVVIRNTTDKFDHFYDNVEMDLLKALCLYVYHEYKDKDRTFAESYKILINQSLEAIDGIFDRLPTSHPAKGPYRLFAKAEKVKGNAVLGLGKMCIRDRVFIIAPDKGHEFARACTNIGGEFIKISSSSKSCINVMEIRKKNKETNAILDGAVMEYSELAAKIQDLHIFLSLIHICGFTGNKSGFGKERHDTSGESIQGNFSRERRTEANAEKETGEQKEYRKEVCGRKRGKKITNSRSKWDRLFYRRENERRPEQ